MNHIAYNAKGQRVLIAFGNGVMTRYAYDPRTFRLARLRTEQFSQSGDTWCGTGAPPIQDFAYQYDLVGNITQIQGRTLNSGLPATPDALDRIFKYEPIYRLSEATGRECAWQPPDPIWDDSIRCNDPTKTASYTQTCSYDPAGNLAELRHQAANTALSYTKTLVTGNNHNGASSNRLYTVTLGQNHTNQTTYSYTYDENGNLIQETLSRHFIWDHADRLIGFRNQATLTSTPSVEVHYLYDASGMRVKKWTRTNGTGIGESITYIDGTFEHERWRKNGNSGEVNHLHVMDDQSRVAIIRVGAKHPDDGSETVQYHLGDHLGSSSVLIGGKTAADNDLINLEEYYPYGETSFGSFSKKRYRFNGKERDEESGLYYHSRRYYSPWLERWISCDPIGPVNQNNLYVAFGNNPLKFTDPSGLENDDQYGMPEVGSNPSQVSGSENIDASCDSFTDISIEGEKLPGGMRCLNTIELTPEDIDSIDKISFVKGSKNLLSFYNSVIRAQYVVSINDIPEQYLGPLNEAIKNDNLGEERAIAKLAFDERNRIRAYPNNW